jgi:DNA polymerase III sliding clamp (beta) subunit (PCNA family)
MKITVPTQALLDAVNHASAVAASKSPKPVLECVAFRADPVTGLSLEATDLDVGIRLHVDGAEILEAGSLLVPATRLQAVVREMDQETTTLVEKDGSLAVDSDRSHFRIRGEDVDAFVTLPYFPEGQSVTVPRTGGGSRGPPGRWRRSRRGICASSWGRRACPCSTG